MIPSPMSEEAAIQQLPQKLQDQARQFWQRIHERANTEQFSILQMHQGTINQFWAQSPWAAENCIQSPELLLDLLQSQQFQYEWSYANYLEQLQTNCGHCQNETELTQALRLLRRRLMTRIAWRDLLHLADLSQTMAELSAFADAVINFCLPLLANWLQLIHGVPRNVIGDPQSLLVIAVGKLGSQELNFSSDIDLIFCYPDPGNTQGGDRSISNEKYFSKLAQSLIKLLQTVTADGSVFRVDMRLRPHGDGGPLVLHIQAMNDYYQEQGRDWERYALIKARVINTDPTAMSRMLAIFKPFVYRRYVDYGAIESLRQMKQLIERDIKAKDLRSDIKRGPGGIRQIEFIGQVFQLIHGGKDRRLQQRKILSVLRYLYLNHILSQEAVEALTQAYVLLRNVEHRLQMVADRQTHVLPVDENEQIRLAFSLGYSDWETFAKVLKHHRQTVQQYFDDLLAPPEANSETSGNYCLIDSRRIWLEKLEPASTIELLEKIGLPDPNRIHQLLISFADCHRVRQMDPQSRKRLDELMPQLIQILGQVQASEQIVMRILQLLEAITRRSVYLALLLEHPDALTQLIQLFAASPWIADHVADYPYLLDDCLRLNVYMDSASEQELEDELRQTLLSIPEHDLEEQMEALRRFKLSQLLRAAVLEVLRNLPVQKVSQHLTHTATVILRQVEEIARKVVLAKPAAIVDLGSETALADFAMVAYGKLGGLELNYDSDLDLVFLHGAAEGQEELAVRLAQRIIHILNLRTASGILYQVDTRLRPSGSSGLLVSSIDAFAEYQQQHAWTWEHQALVRARVISGSVKLKTEFNNIRRQILTGRRDIASLQRDVIEMRQRMRSAQKSKSQLENDIKQCNGGLTDIEFIVQFGVLAWSQAYPGLIEVTDGFRILDLFADHELMQLTDLRMLCQAYQYYRSAINQRILNNQSLQLAADEAVDYRQQVSDLWRRLLVVTA